MSHEAGTVGCKAVPVPTMGHEAIPTLGHSAVQSKHAPDEGHAAPTEHGPKNAAVPTLGHSAVPSKHSPDEGHAAPTKHGPKNAAVIARLASIAFLAGRAWS